MPLSDTLERYLGRFAVPGLIRYVVAFNALVFILIYLDPAYGSALHLDPQKVFEGQVWRLFTWIFIPNTTSIIWIIFYLMFTWWLGDLLEEAWGTFRLNIYYLVGYIGCTASAFLFGQTFANYALTASLLYAVATLAPNLPIMLFAIIPLKIKWIAILSASIFLLTAIVGDWGTRGTVIVTFFNYFLFFGPQFVRNLISARQATERRAKFEAAAEPLETLHCCNKCQRTEVTNPELDFRISAVDGHEYCLEHLPSSNR